MQGKSNLRKRHDHDNILRQLEGTCIYTFIEECCQLRTRVSPETREEMWNSYHQTGDANAKDKVFRSMVPLAVQNALRKTPNAQPHEREAMVQEAIVDLLFYVESAQNKKYATFVTGMYRYVIDAQTSEATETPADLRLLAQVRVSDLTDVEEKVEQTALREILDRVLPTLCPIEEYVLRRRFGIDSDEWVNDAMPERPTLEQIGLELKCTAERVRQIYNKALRKMRHPSRAKWLVDFA